MSNGVVMVEHYGYKALTAIRRSDERFRRRYRLTRHRLKSAWSMKLTASHRYRRNQQQRSVRDE
jgi:hypothetical protein